MALSQDWMVAAQWLNVIVFAAVAIRLWMLRLHQKYRVFFGYLVFSTIRSTALLALDVQGAEYFWTWLLTEPIYWIVNILVVRELFLLVLSRHRGLGQLSQWLLHGGLGAGVVVASASLLAKGVAELPGQSAWLWTAVVISRCVGITILVFLLALVTFLNWYPVSLSKNLVRHCIIFASYFLSMTVGYLVRALTGNAFTDSVNLAMVTVSCICAMVWLSLTRVGEERRIMLRNVWTHSDERVMLGHLESLNTQLLRATRK